ncbi:uncharacterized protein [Garra rufa]|uniref:uncharacterized protein n=1 Tax=Garra rufa TaxID=137080 RepID=UPI003CCE6D9D
MRNHSILLWILLFVDGVFGAAEVAVSVSVMKGDSVTLHTDVSELQNDDIIDWMSEDGVIIAKIENKKISEKYVPEKKFEGRLELDHKTGSLTIKNITSQHEGIYKLDIGGGHLISKNFSVTVHDDVESLSVMEGDSVTLHTGVTKIQKDGVIRWFGDQGTCIAALTCAAKTVSVKEGESVTLHTGLIDIQRYDLILWKFEDHLIAEINKGTNQFIVLENADVRFKGRLQLNEKTGSLNISGSETTDSGDYHLNMSNKMCTLHRTIVLTVKAIVTPKGHTEDPGLHPDEGQILKECELSEKNEQSC